ncbi:MAG: pyridoxal phosphate-dependent aminotransferase [Treponemataceae bacterium]
MPIADAIREAQSKGSLIRKMFEEGAVLKKKHGAENVFDFSLGNPDLEPPAAFHEALVRLASEDAKGSHGYMTNAGYPHVREALAKKVSRDHGVSIDGSRLVMSVGAAGAINSVFKVIINPGDEVVIPKPYFVDYGAYVGNSGGRMVLVNSKNDFDLDVGEIERALTPKTAAVLINSPHNPTGRIYPRSTIKALAAVLNAHGKKTGRFPYLIADEPYREIVYGGREVPGVLCEYDESIVVTSYSKSLSLPGERIGYIALGPKLSEADLFVASLAFATRTLGFMNAPALMQRLVAELTEARVDVGIYAHRLSVFKSVLDEAGIRYAEPEGAFYLFCEVPEKKAGPNAKDDLQFVNFLKDQLVLAVPGIGFGFPGWFRLAYCIDEKIIDASRKAFKTAVEKWLNS